MGAEVQGVHSPSTYNDPVIYGAANASMTVSPGLCGSAQRGHLAHGAAETGVGGGRGGRGAQHQKGLLGRGHLSFIWKEN